MKVQLALVLIAAISRNPAHAQVSPHLTISSPLEYQVFQRSTRLHGVIVVRGSVLAATRVEARVKGTSTKGRLPGRWQRLALDQANKQFSAQLPVIAGGFYSVEIKATNITGQPALLTVRNVGVGEVFVSPIPPTTARSRKQRRPEWSVETSKQTPTEFSSATARSSQG